jgi:hypothetical protein
MKKNEIVIDGVSYIPKGSEVQTIAKKNKKGLQYCIIRTYSAGVWSGWIDTKCKDMAQEVYEARRLWRFWSEFTLSALAVKGMKEGKEKENKYAIPVEQVILTQIIEIIPCSESAKNQIINHPNYSE